MQQQVSLAGYSTMGLGGTAAFLTDATSRMELLEALSWAQQQNLPVIMVGGGSNIFWRDEGFNGVVIVNKIMRYEQFDEGDGNVYITVGSGEDWDSVVARAVTEQLTGIEALSLVPGTTGATPIQNVGAYGQEVANTIVTVEAFDTQVSDFVTVAGSDCGFGYRSSRFNQVDRGRFYITAVTFHLQRANPEPPFYSTLQDYFNTHGITEFTPATVREAVIAIRSSRLPDPAKVHNNGSFFANPIISPEQTLSLRDAYPDIPSWPLSDGRIKIPAAWLIEQVGFKDKHDPQTGMSTWPQQPLVLVNETAHRTADLLAFKKSIVDAVETTFGIVLQQEPELLPRL